MWEFFIISFIAIFLALMARGLWLCWKDDREIRRREQIDIDRVRGSNEPRRSYLDRLNELAEKSMHRAETNGNRNSSPSFINQKQKKILIATAVLIFILVLFPPFQMVYPTKMVLNLGFGFLFVPPEFGTGIYGSVNTDLLLAEVFIAALIGVFLTFAFKNKK